MSVFIDSGLIAGVKMRLLNSKTRNHVNAWFNDEKNAIKLYESTQCHIQCLPPVLLLKHC